MTIHREADYRGRTVRNAQGVISQNLDTVESGVDIAIETAKEAVHELRERQSMNCVGKHRMSLAKLSGAYKDHGTRSGQGSKDIWNHILGSSSGHCFS